MTWKWIKVYSKVVSISSVFVVLFLCIGPGGEEYEKYEEYYSPSNISLYDQRLIQINATCEKYGLSDFSIIQTMAVTNSSYRELQDKYFTRVAKEYSLMHLPKFSMLYCWIHKAASSSWNKIFFDKVNKKVKSTNLHTAAQVFRPKAAMVEGLLETSTSFFFVRHPFERLVSAYRDKFELGMKSDWCYKMYVGDILNITLPTYQKKDSSYLSAIYLKIKNLDRPTFPQFVAYLLRISVLEYNDHWSPYYLHCRICQNRYKVVGKFETLVDDVQYISNMTNLNVNINQFPWANKKGTENNVAIEYFKQIDQQSVSKLYNIYKVDFEMFQYSADEYLD